MQCGLTLDNVIDRLGARRILLLAQSPDCLRSRYAGLISQLDRLNCHLHVLIAELPAEWSSTAQSGTDDYQARVRAWIGGLYNTAQFTGHRVSTDAASSCADLLDTDSPLRTALIDRVAQIRPECIISPSRHDSDPAQACLGLFAGMMAKEAQHCECQHISVLPSAAALAYPLENRVFATRSGGLDNTGQTSNHPALWLLNELEALSSPILCEMKNICHARVPAPLLDRHEVWVWPGKPHLQSVRLKLRNGQEPEVVSLGGRQADRLVVLPGPGIVDMGLAGVVDPIWINVHYPQRRRFRQRTDIACGWQRVVPLLPGNPQRSAYVAVIRPGQILSQRELLRLAEQADHLILVADGLDAGELRDLAKQVTGRRSVHVLCHASSMSIERSYLSGLRYALALTDCANLVLLPTARALQPGSLADLVSVLYGHPHAVGMTDDPGMASDHDNIATSAQRPLRKLSDTLRNTFGSLFGSIHRSGKSRSLYALRRDLALHLVEHSYHLGRRERLQDMATRMQGVAPVTIHLRTGAVSATDNPYTAQTGGARSLGVVTSLQAYIARNKRAQSISHRAL